MNEKIQNILTEIESVIVGKNENVEKILMAILAQGHVLMEDVPGVGKTTTALTFAKVLGLDTRRVQFTSDTVPSDVIGYSVYDKSVDSFVYKPGAIMTNLLLADEINRTSSKTQSALLEAMEEHRVTVDGQTYDLPTPFVVLATQNPTGSAGTTLLPSSQLDRFLIRLSMATPTTAARSTSSATATAKIHWIASSPSSPKMNCFSSFRRPAPSRPTTASLTMSRPSPKPRAPIPWSSLASARAARWPSAGWRRPTPSSPAAISSCRRTSPPFSRTSARTVSFCRPKPA